ncbi:rasGAP-activating-like protein 1 isoform X1 [Seriola lalandi dorsalis]|uniref:rasGAP-activating-like protein 1 isoform X1 n=1 Tax=Seriola lalandi dorsalis TaxID=1841481 RepID=UPI000C6F82E5|nr:rasGAP-activating-like protein 1 isoform X1 [Seriola lalandi dorsalis]XP_023249896.1 rasGAP-activating-like protein 1 isoform X1 [Seriola lalandi dorsalis]XP_056232927.1 rasGAP-activating-like protein 1 isoform X1 [Seriola aureovittata]XP_056232928.1 rasGAP-activating-like protein 1 isoform X1 [Seriola aureovittata]
MAKNTSLYFRIVEGRNLPAKDVSGTSDPYCIVKVDNEVVARTATVWKNLNPFWGEEYTLHLPTGFHSLSFHVMDEDTIGHDDVIGKITLSKEAIGSQAKGLDSWLNLTRVNPDEEVQGEIHLSLELLKDTEKISLRCQVIEARDLAPRDISGTSDPFARVIFNNHSAETSIIKKTRFPHWGETLELDFDPEELSEEGTVTVEVWDWDMVGKNDFLGKVEIPFACLHKTPLLEGWFRLLPLGNNEVDAGGKLGALRLKVRLVEDRILPSVYYQPLIDLLVESVISPIEVEDSSALTMLEEVTTVESRQDVAMTLVKIYLGQGLVVPFLDYLNTREVNHTTDPNTLFRSNSLASKAMEQFMKAVGMLYLHEVLKPIINRIFEEKKYIELDPCKIDLNRTRRISFKGAVSEAEVRDSSVEMLQGYLTSITESIVGSVDQCPPVMRVAFKQLHKRVEEQFAEPENEDVKYLAISGFFFLRFFAPAILTPKLFQLRDQHADTRTSRTLLLLAKALQSVGNLGLQLGHGKEQWMAPLHPIILRSVASVKDFLDKLIDIDHDIVSEVPQRAVFMPSVTVKEGYLHKHKAEGPQLLSRFAFKKRYFWLTSETLSYAKTPDWQVRSSIPIQCVCAVERVDENAFQQQNVMQVISQDNDGQLHTMYIQCKNVNELNQWLSAIRKVSIYNERMLPSFHPGAHRSGKWTCCLQADRPVTGCSRTHSAVTLGDWSDPLDPDVETQTIYKQLLQGRDKLRKKYLEVPDTDQTPSNKEKKISSDSRPDGAECNVQPLKPGQSVAARLLAVTEDLEQAHATFQCREKEDATGVILNP